MSRRLPVYFLLDVSESMAGDELYQMEEVVSGVITHLKKDPHCLETVHVGVSAFAGKPRTLRPLTDLIDFTTPELPVGGGTALGKALDHIMDQIENEVVLNTAQTRGDWQPLIFLITDGAPTDNVSAALTRWKRQFSNRANLVAISMGGAADSTILHELTENVFIYLDTVPEAYLNLIQWISLSIQSHSKSIASGAENKVELSKIDLEILEVSSTSIGYKKPEHEKYISVIGRCENKKHPYLVKFRYGPEEIADLNLPGDLNCDYYLTASVPLRDSYFDLCDDTQSNEGVSLHRLLGQPPCPHCGASTSMAVDNSCGNVHCLDGEGIHVCPWCEETGEYFEVDRGEGELLANKGLG